MSTFISIPVFVRKTERGCRGPKGFASLVCYKVKMGPRLIHMGDRSRTVDRKQGEALITQIGGVEYELTDVSLSQAETEKFGQPSFYGCQYELNLGEDVDVMLVDPEEKQPETIELLRKRTCPLPTESDHARPPGGHK